MRHANHERHELRMNTVENTAIDTGATRKRPLARALTARHIRFMALGSAIGTGLFYGSSAAIQAAGPAVLLAYMIAGAAVFMVM